MKVFFFANILPALIFRFKHFKLEPMKNIKRTLIQYARSVAFLTLACALPPILMCHISKALGQTSRLSGVLSFAVGALMVMLETL